MSNKSVVLECVSTGAQYFKLKVGGTHLKFEGGRATLTEDQWAKLQAQMKELGCFNLIGREFGPVGTIKNPATIRPVEAVRGLDKGSLDASSPQAKADATVEDHLRQLDAERHAGASASASGPSTEHINPEDAQSLVDEQARLDAEALETERLVREQAKLDAKNKAEAKARAREEKKAQAAKK